MRKFLLTLCLLPSLLLAADNPIPPSNGGTGKNNGVNTITVGGNLNTANTFTTSGNNPLTLTTTGSTNVTLPTSGTLATTAGSVASVTGSANVLANGTSGTPQTGSVTVNTPQNIQTTSTPQFGAVTLSGAGAGVNITNNTVSSGSNLGPLNWLGQDSLGGAVFYSRIIPGIVSNTNGAMTSKNVFSVQEGGTLTDYFELNGSTQTINAYKSLSLTTPLSLSSGGTNANLTPDNGGILYSTATATAILPSTATARRILLSGASAPPTWSVATYPSASGTAGQVVRSNGTNNVYSNATFSDTYTASNILYSNGSNTVTGLATANNGVLITSGAGVPSISSTLPSAVQSNITALGAISALTASSLTATDGSKNLVSTTPQAIGVTPDSVYFGDGSDGAFTLSDGSTTTLTSDVFYSSITLTNNSKIVTGGWKIFCSGTTSLASGSSISRNGNAASGSTAGAALTGTSTGGSFAGGAGGTIPSGNGAAGATGTTNFGANGGRGADGAVTTTGGAAGITPVPNNNYYLPMSFWNVAVIPNNTSAGSGGGGGGGGVAQAGGGGGSGGGYLFLATKVLSGAGTVEAKGGAGGNATSPAGVGAGGGGGVIVVVYQSFSGGFTSAQIDVSAGAAGTGGSTTNLTAGTAGRKILYNI